MGVIVEYFGDGVIFFFCIGKGIICNMGVEIGVMMFIFGYDDLMCCYFVVIGCQEVVDVVDKIVEYFMGDKEVYENLEQYFDQLIEINLFELELMINGFFMLDCGIQVFKMCVEVIVNEWLMKVEWGLIGFCINFFYEDMFCVVFIVEQVVVFGVMLKVEFGINLGFEQVCYIIECDGIFVMFEKMGMKVFINVCGFCIGQWDCEGVEKQEKNMIVYFFNCNFFKCVDGNLNIYVFVIFFEMVVVLVIVGDFGFNLIMDMLINDKGEQVKLQLLYGDELLKCGFVVDDNGYQVLVVDGSSVVVDVVLDLFCL